MNPDNSKCPGSCFRPVGLALDSKGRMFVSSDATGEIYVLARTGMGSSTTATGSTSGTATSPTSTKEGAGPRLVDGELIFWAVGVAVLLLW
jgi:hypothetical protein